MKKLYTNLNENTPLFYCYSINLYRYLKNNGLRYESKYVRQDSGKTCWIFKRTEAFEFCYKQFGEAKHAALEEESKRDREEKI